MIQSILTASLLLCCMACAPRLPMPDPQIVNLSAVSAEELIVVGKVELMPPLQEDEQQLGENAEAFKNAFILYIGGIAIDVASMKPLQFDDAYFTTVGSDFFIKVNRTKSLIISGGRIFKIFSPPSEFEAMDYPASLQIALKPKDDAVYIGTIQLHRGRSGRITTITIRDDYVGADAAFKERFGTKNTLRKSLVTALKTP